MKIGFIGTENIGRNLLQAFIQAQVFLPNEIMISHSSSDVINQLAIQHPNLLIARNNQELIKDTACFFICVKPADYGSVLQEIQDLSRPEQIALSTSHLVMIKDLENLIRCKVAKIVNVSPEHTLNNFLLYILGTRILDSEKYWIKQLLSTICQPLSVEESSTRLISSSVWGSKKDTGSLKDSQIVKI